VLENKKFKECPGDGKGSGRESPRRSAGVGDPLDGGRKGGLQKKGGYSACGWLPLEALRSELEGGEKGLEESQGLFFGKI